MEARTIVIILGGGGHAREVASYIANLVELGERIELAGFIDEINPPGPWGSAPILGDFGALENLARANPDSLLRYVTAVGDNRLRSQFVTKVEDLGLRNLIPWTVRHPSAIVGNLVDIGDGGCLAPGSIITTRVKTGRHCIFNVKASISHDCVIGDFVNINPGATICGHVEVGTGCFIGAGATVINRVSIGDWTIVGAGAVVVDDLPAGVTAVGVPARVIVRHDYSGD